MEAHSGRQDGAPVEAPPLQWSDPLDALRWSILTLSRATNYATSSMIPNMPRGSVPWDEVQDLALTIHAKALAVEPAQAGHTLRAAAGGPEAEPFAFENAVRALSRQVRRQCPEFGELRAFTRRGMCTVTLLRLVHLTARPRERRHPPFIWYAKAADVSRETVYRRRWRTIITDLEETAQQWRDAGAADLRAKLEQIDVIT